MNNAATKTVLVTGGAGYIGSHTCKILAQEGYQPIAFDNLSSGHMWAAKWGPLEKGDILDRTALDRAIEKYRPSACLHFAAFAYVGESVLNPGKYYRNNVAGSLTLLEALRDHGVDQFVLSSTCAPIFMRPTDCDPSRCAISMRPVQIQTSRSERTTIPKRTWCHSFSMPPAETARPSRSSETTTRRPMEHAFETIST